MNHNLLKCTFSIQSEKFLGNIVNAKGIEANLEKIEVIINLKTA